jgi:hypothetical protein
MLFLFFFLLQHNVDSVVVGEGLHSRSNSARGISGGNRPSTSARRESRTAVSGGSCVTDLERMSSMKGITVLRGRVPNVSRTLTDQFGEEHVESYL